MEDIKRVNELTTLFALSHIYSRLYLKCNLDDYLIKFESLLQQLYVRTNTKKENNLVPDDQSCADYWIGQAEAILFSEKNWNFYISIKDILRSRGADPVSYFASDEMRDLVDYYMARPYHINKNITHCYDDNTLIAAIMNY